jgi:hypothetical protein
LPATHVLYRHDDGRWFEARLLQQWRVPGGWRVQVTYSTAPGFTFTRGEPADSPRLAPLGTSVPRRPTVADIAGEMEAASLRSRLG